MKAPDFWYSQKKHVLPALLSPLSNAYARMARRHRENAAAQEIAIPVICVGNIVSGGAGKTPTAMALLKLIQDNKTALSPFFLTRGYRGKIEGPERVDGSHDPVLWGDEALLLSRHAPTIVSKNRYQGGVLAQDLGADLVIMDDGMQNYTIAKDLTFCVIDGQMGFGNAQVIPQGPLRQTLDEGLQLSDAFILIGGDTRNVRAALPAGKPVFGAALKVRADHALRADTPYLAFCGIGFPDKFKKSIAEAGLKTVEFRDFSDHHDYGDKDITYLIDAARAKGARLLTTEKDYARLPEFDGKDLIDILPVEIVFEEPGDVADFIKSKISA